MSGKRGDCAAKSQAPDRTGLVRHYQCWHLTLNMPPEHLEKTLFEHRRTARKKHKHAQKEGEEGGDFQPKSENTRVARIYRNAYTILQGGFISQLN